MTDLLEIEYDHPISYSIGCQSTTEFRNSRIEDIAITVKGAGNHIGIKKISQRNQLTLEAL